MPQLRGASSKVHPSPSSENPVALRALATDSRWVDCGIPSVGQHISNQATSLLEPDPALDAVHKRKSLVHFAALCVLVFGFERANACSPALAEVFSSTPSLCITTLPYRTTRIPSFSLSTTGFPACSNSADVCS